MMRQNDLTFLRQRFSQDIVTDTQLADSKLLHVSNRFALHMTKIVSHYRKCVKCGARLSGSGLPRLTSAAPTAASKNAAIGVRLMVSP